MQPPPSQISRIADYATTPTTRRQIGEVATSKRVNLSILGTGHARVSAHAMRY